MFSRKLRRTDSFRRWKRVQALSVLIADVLRRDFGLGTPKVTFAEVERYKEEVSKYSPWVYNTDQAILNWK